MNTRFATRSMLVGLIVVALLGGLCLTPAALAERQSPESFVEWFINRPLEKDLAGVERSLAPDFVWADRRASLPEAWLEIDRQTYLDSLGWESVETLDVKPVTIRRNQDEDGLVSVSAYYDVWERDLFGIMGPLRQVEHFLLVPDDDEGWLIKRITRAA